MTNGRFQVFGVAARLLLGVVGVEVFALRFEHAQHAAEAVLEQIVRAAVPRMQLELDLLRVKQIPAAELQRLVDQDAGEGFRLAHCRLSSSVSQVAKKNTPFTTGNHPALMGETGGTRRWQWVTRQPRTDGR